MSGIYLRARETEYAMEYFTPILFSDAANSLGCVVQTKSRMMGIELMYLSTRFR